LNVTILRKEKNLRENFLIEIGVEELPAEPFLKELPNIEKKWRKELEENRFDSEFKFFYTPRRFVFWHKDFERVQKEEKLEFFGAPVAIAKKNPKALEGFARKCGIAVSEVGEISKDGKEVLYYSRVEEGKDISVVLEEMLERFLKSLNFGKSMRWGNGEFSFIRPIHSIVAMSGKESIDLEVFGVKSRPETFGHRNSKEPQIFLTHVGDYFCNLPKQGVLVQQGDREIAIRQEIEKIERAEGVKVEVESELLQEIIAITEEPTPLLGEFSEEFLELPDEVIVTSMREHQRYFPVYRNGELTNRFVVVSNALTDDFSTVISGNERVLRARLSDALFFYRNDLKNGLQTSGLEKITFVKGLGNLAEKVEREKEISELFPCENTSSLNRAVSIAKADLLSEMVYEFTELQGTMGGYYSEKLGEADEVSIAIREQYLPNSEGGSLPSSKLSAIVAISNKLDTLFALFSIGENPTGSRDPFGLRRAVNGIVRISLEHNFQLDISQLFSKVSHLYKEFNFQKLENFFFERVIHHYKDTNPSIVKSVLSVEKEILEIDKKVIATKNLVARDDFSEVLSTFKRVANILDGQFGKVQEELLSEEAEKKLWEKSLEVSQIKFQNYSQKLEALFSLKPELDSFFDSVMVNSEDLEIRRNRKALMNSIYSQFLQISDIKEITGK
jgi:glycyl-tRNA synthetase beta chain